MDYYIITKKDETGREEYYSYSRAFASTFEPRFTHNIVDAKFFHDKTSAMHILNKIKESGLKDYKVIKY